PTSFTTSSAATRPDRSGAVGGAQDAAVGPEQEFARLDEVAPRSRDDSQLRALCLQRAGVGPAAAVAQRFERLDRVLGPDSHSRLMAPAAHHKMAARLSRISSESAKTGGLPRPLRHGAISRHCSRTLVGLARPCRA